MDFRSNLHTHTIYSDGSGTVEEMILKALELGFVSIGFSDHAPTTVNGKDRIDEPFSPSMLKGNYNAYLAEVRRLQGKYKGKIQVLLGLEEDYLSENDHSELDYTIGAVHYLQDPNGLDYFAVDWCHENFQQAIAAYGSVKALVREYYNQVANIAEIYQPDILAHFDLVTKLNEGDYYFSEEEIWYREAALEALERVSKTRCILEINTGAVTRGYRKEPYPALFLLGKARELEIPITISSDCHHAKDLAGAFPESLEWAHAAGYERIRMMNHGWEDVPIE